MRLTFVFLVSSAIAMLATSLAATPHTDGPTEEQQKDWKTVLGPAGNDPRLADWLAYVDPQPFDNLKVMSTEKLNPRLWLRSMEFFRNTFADAGNPWANNQPWPTRYSVKAKRVSLLLYEWQTVQYACHLHESYAMMLLRVRLRTEFGKPPEQLTSTRLAQIIQDVLLPKFYHKQTPAEAFRLSTEIKSGQFFTNFGDPKQYGRFWETEVEKLGVVLIVSGDELFVLKAKDWTRYKTRTPEGAGLKPEEWLDMALYEKDGKTLIFERVHGRKPEGERWDDRLELDRP